MNSVINFDMHLLSTDNANLTGDVYESDSSESYSSMREETYESMTGSCKRKIKLIDRQDKKAGDLEDLEALLQTIYADEFFDNDLRKYLYISWQNVDKLETFHQTVYSVAEQYL